MHDSRHARHRRSPRAERRHRRRRSRRRDLDVDDASPAKSRRGTSPATRTSRRPSGDVQLSDVRGNVDVGTVSGEIDLRGVTGEDRARQDDERRRAVRRHDRSRGPIRASARTPATSGCTFRATRTRSSPSRPGAAASTANFPITLRPGEHAIGVDAKRSGTSSRSAAAARASRRDVQRRHQHLRRTVAVEASASGDSRRSDSGRTESDRLSLRPSTVRTRVMHPPVTTSRMRRCAAVVAVAAR